GRENIDVVVAGPREYVRSLDQLRRLGEPRLPQKERVDIPAFECRHHLGRLHRLHFDLVRGQLVFFDVVYEVEMAPGGSRIADGASDQVVRLLDLVARGCADLLPTRRRVRGDVELPSFVPAGEAPQLGGRADIRAAREERIERDISVIEGLEARLQVVFFENL